MRPIQPEELSALLDGELDPQREQEVRTQLASNAGLRAQFDALRQLDEECRTGAATAVFTPLVQMPGTPRPKMSTLPIVLVVSILMLIRLMSKLLDLEAVTWGLNVAACIAVLATTVWLLRTAVGADEREPVVIAKGGRS